VERTPGGVLRIPEGADNVGVVGMASGSLIGMLVGVLGGPVGVLVGWGSGALMGGVFDIDRAEKSDEALSVLGRAIPPESTAVIASVGEPAVEVIDWEMAKLGGEVTHRPVAESWMSWRRRRRLLTPPRAKRGEHCAKSARPRSKPTSTNAWES
jgi:uncharacterized membrane protein